MINCKDFTFIGTALGLTVYRLQISLWSNNLTKVIYFIISYILNNTVHISGPFNVLFHCNKLFYSHGIIVVRFRNKSYFALVRAHFRNFWPGKAFFSRIWHAVVLTQFGNADSKSAPCQAIFCVFPTQNSKTKWPPKLVKMLQLYITAWLTMNIKTSFRCIKTHLSNILKVTWISPCAFVARGQNPEWPPLQGNVL